MNPKENCSLQLIHEFNQFKLIIEDEVLKLSIQNRELLSTIDTLKNDIYGNQKPMNKITSFKDMKNKLKDIFSPNAYPEVFSTKSILKKVFCILCMIALLIACVFYIYQNYQDFSGHNVVTQIKIKENKTLLFPAISVCLYDVRNRSIVRNLKDFLCGCSFESSVNTCTADDFENIRSTDARKGDFYNCFKFNGGDSIAARDGNYPSLNATKSLWISTKFGKYTGLTLNLNVSKNEILFYYVGDNRVRPVFFEFNNFLQTGKSVYVGIKKTVDTKLPQPYDVCQQNIDPDTSDLVRELMGSRVTYRKVNCYELCLQEYAARQNLPIDSVYSDYKFSYENECSGSCPSECTSSIFDLDSNEIVYENASFLKVNFHFVDNKYTELTQIVKTTEADFISNTGGVLGLFLDISFYHVYKFLACVFELISG